MPTPTVSFTDERLANGLRLIIAEDHLAPVVAVNLWYDVGSKHEVAGKTGFAHLFEHVMFQGSRNVGKAEHIALVQAAGGTMNGTTWLDRTNYFETHAVAPARARALARGGPDGDAPRRAQPGEPRQPARGREEREALVVRQPAVRLVEREAPGPPLPAGASLPPHDDRLDGGPRRGVGRGRQRVLPDLLRAEQRGPVGRRRRRPGRSPALGRALLRRASRPTRRSRRWATCRCRRSLGEERRETVHDQVPLPRVYVGVPGAGLRRPPARRARHRRARSSPAARARRLHRRLVRDERIAQDVALFTLGFVGGASITAGWATVRPGVEVARVEAAFHEELERIAREPVSRRRAGPGEGADRDRGAGRACRGSRSGPTGSRCTRRCSTTRT